MKSSENQEGEKSRIASCELLSEIIGNREKIAELHPDVIPALMTQVAALQSVLAARLLLPDARESPASGGYDDQLITVEEAAEQLNLTPDYLYGEIRQGRFPAIEIGRYKKVRKGDIPVWIKQHRINGSDTQPYIAHNGPHLGKRAPAKKRPAVDYAARIRGPRQRRTEIECPQPTGDQSPRVVGVIGTGTLPTKATEN